MWGREQNADLINLQYSERAIPVLVFSSDELRIVADAPVKVTLHTEDGMTFANCDRLHVYASGESESEAISDLHSQVIYFYKHYSQLSADEVIGQAADLRNTYLSRFQVSP